MKQVCLAVLVLCALLVALAHAADPPKVSKLTIASPAAGETLHGMVQVVVRVVPAAPDRVPSTVHVAIAGPPWTPAKRVGETDDWCADVDTRMAPNGEVNLLAVGWIPQEKRAAASSKVNLDNAYQCYFGDFHGHTCYSDGTLFPEDAHAYARETAGLDAFILTDHLELQDEMEWQDTREQAWKANQDGAFAVLPGLEWTKKQGHMNLYDPPTRKWPVETGAFYEAIADAGVVAKFNHPGDGSTVFDALAYSEAGDKAVELMEVRSDQEETAYIRALNNGWHLAPDGSSDTHSPNWGKCGTWSGVLMPGLSKRNLWDALKNRRIFSTHDRNCRIFLWVNGTLMGGIAEAPATSAQVEVAVEDPDAADTIARIELFQDGEIVQVDEPKTAARRWETTSQPAPGKHYYFVKVTETDGNQMWSAPVWITTAAP